MTPARGPAVQVLQARARALPALVVGLLLSPDLAQAAAVDAARMSPWWGFPFAGLLATIALLPLAAPNVWHRHQGKVVAAWAAAFVLPFAAAFGAEAALAGVVHALLAEYLPFVALIGSLYVVAGGIHLRGTLRASPALNTGLLGAGAVLANVMGTTGASMLLIRPLIRANAHRRSVTHVVVFFIFIVSNAGGALTPLGDPPLFLGFLKGVDFFWTLRHLLPQTLFMVAALLLLFYLLDAHHQRRDAGVQSLPTADPSALGIDGRINFLLLAGVVALVLMSGLWKSGVAFNLAGTDVAWHTLVRDLGLVALAGVSLLCAPSARASNEFSWAPLREVALLFAAIFVAIVPVIAMLQAGADGPFAALITTVTGPDGKPLPAMYFWASGILSSFLDNAPAYLVLFNAAGGDPRLLMTTLAGTLAAISAGSVFMGANTYIGNAPNLMVKAIAEDRGVKMPSFFGYMRWSMLVLLPLFAVMTLIWF